MKLNGKRIERRADRAPYLLREVYSSGVWMTGDQRWMWTAETGVLSMGSYRLRGEGLRIEFVELHAPDVSSAQQLVALASHALREGRDGDASRG